jgi:hypothetical protein
MCQTIQSANLHQRMSTSLTRQPKKKNREKKKNLWFYFVFLADMSNFKSWTDVSMMWRV